MQYLEVGLGLLALVGYLLTSSNILAIFNLRQGAVYYAGLAIYNLFFHPLADYPGPKLAALSDVRCFELSIDLD